jgi:hypothetical protein
VVSENGFPDTDVPDEVIEMSEEMYRLASNVEDLEAHVSAIEDGLDAELFD